MIDTNKLIRDIGIDIVTISTMWALINSPYIAKNHYLSLIRGRNSSMDTEQCIPWYNNPNNLPVYTTILGLGMSTYIVLRSFCYFQRGIRL
jgi:hypothetical protein